MDGIPWSAAEWFRIFGRKEKGEPDVDMSGKVNEAHKHYQKGNFAQAERECTDILALEPDNSEVLHLLGLSCHFQGRHEEATAHLERALQSDPDNADIHYDLGNVYHELGRLGEAKESYRRALEREPEHMDALTNLGMVLHDSGEMSEAIAVYQRALVVSPNNPLIHNNIALAYQDNNEVEKAIAHFGRALQLEPNYADVYYNMGHIFMAEGQHAQAFMYFRKSVELNPGLTDAYIGMAHILVSGGRFDEALPILRELARRHGDSAEIHNMLGVALSEVWALEESLEHLGLAVELDADSAEARNNLGNTLCKMGNFDEGMEHIQRALYLKPDFVEAFINLGAAQKDRGRFDEAKESFEKALSLDPENAEARFGQALLDLTGGNFERGWEGYEWRRHLKFARARTFPFPEWTGESLEGRTLFVHAEQGIGDEIMFSSCLPDVLSRAGHVVVEAEERLAPILGRSLAGATVIPRLAADRYPKDLPAPDFQVAVGSLPRLVRPNLSSFPRRTSYFAAEEEKLRMWKERFREIGSGLAVGISWRGGSTPDIVRVRSIDLDRWAGVLSLGGVQFVNLQYGDCREEIRAVEQKLGTRVHDWEDADPLKDLDGFAAKIAALDLVISVDNSAVHLAGALGVPVWVLLPYVSDWRWMREFEDTPWYESVRLFRQRHAGEWSDVFARVEGRLASLAARDAHPRKAIVFPVERSYRELVERDG